MKRIHFAFALVFAILTGAAGSALAENAANAEKDSPFSNTQDSRAERSSR